MELIVFLPVLLFSVVVHEYAHGWMALRQGDPTAKRLGRLTLNPIPHIDPVGSVIVPLMLWFAPGNFLFGWAKPVPVDPRRFRDYRRGDILVSLAGIAANLLLAFACVVLIVILVYLVRVVPAAESSLSLVREMAAFGILINLILAFFNLIPIPPLDGSHVLYHLLPARLAVRYRDLGRYGILILLGVLFFVPGLLEVFLWPVMALQDLANAFIGLWV